MKFIIGKKNAMLQRYRTDGSVIPVTKVAAERCVVTQVKDLARDGYSAVQLGYGNRRRAAKPQVGHTRGQKPFAGFREFRIPAEEAQKLAVGDSLNVGSFSAGDVVKVTGTSKGRGFQGVVKRHHFKGQPQTHGHKDQLRAPGSSGPGGWQRVRPGKRMPGRMGNDRVTVRNLEVIEVDPSQNVLYVNGAIPGSRNGVVFVSGEGELKIEKPVKATPTPAVDEQSLKFKNQKSK